MGCAPDLHRNAHIRREALRQLELADDSDDDQSLVSLEELALTALDQLADEAVTAED